MTGDLVAGGVQVHDMARAVLDYWFGLTVEQQFGKDADRDRVIAACFGPARDTQPPVIRVVCRVRLTYSPAHVRFAGR